MMVPPVPKSSRGFVQCASFRQPQSPARRADGLLSDDRGLGLAERTLSFVRSKIADFPTKLSRS